MIQNGNGKRQINPRSLENLKLGAEARRQDKVRRNCSLLPQTIKWLEESGNASNMIDILVASAKSGALKFNSNNAHDIISESEAQELRSRLREAEELSENHRLEVERLQASINAHDSMSELEDKLDRSERNCEGLRQENQRLLADAAKADAAISSLRSQLEDQATKSGEWWEKAKLAQEEVERLRQLEKDSTEQIIELTQDGFKAASILKEALKLKAGNGGAIKTYIREALPLIDDL